MKAIVDDIMNNLTSGKHAHGRIFVKDVSDAFDIGSRLRGERWTEAIKAIDFRKLPGLF